MHILPNARHSGLPTSAPGHETPPKACEELLLPDRHKACDQSQSGPLPRLDLAQVPPDCRNRK